MAEIGAQLREARTRARIEIAQMEAQTKIRAKYLRALENEEWELLPGPTYVKSFLKTYGDMLGIDGRQLVHDYKREHEPFQIEGDIGQLSKHSGGRMNRQQSPPPLLRNLALGLLGVVVLGGAAYAFVLKGDDETPAASTPSSGVEDLPADPTTPAADERDVPATPKRVSVLAVASGNATVCLRSGSRVVVKERELESGDRTRTVAGKTVVVTVLTGAEKVKLRVNGKTRALPADAPAGAVTVTVAPSGVKLAGASVTACRPPA